MNDPLFKVSPPISNTLILKIDKEMFIQASQLTFTCSKSTIERLEKGVKYVQS